MPASGRRGAAVNRLVTGAAPSWPPDHVTPEPRRMPVVSIVNPKGGVSKTTTALVLGTGLAARGMAVTIIDADPNRHLIAWRSGPSKSRVRVVADTGRLAQLIDAERAHNDVVL